METIREALAQEIGGHQLYHARDERYVTDDPIPFRLTDRPLSISPQELNDLERVCCEISGYISAVDNLYHQDDTVKELLSRGKPEFFKKDRPAQHLFIRPDIIWTADGFRVCEIETSPFGLGLANALNEAYRSMDYATVTNGELSRHIEQSLPAEGTVVYSDKTWAYEGQLKYLAKKVFSRNGKEWKVKTAIEAAQGALAIKAIYRAFYLKEHDSDEAVKRLLEDGELGEFEWLPSITSHIEEKAVMALIWDNRWEKYFARELGRASYDFLRMVIPKTFVIGEEGHFSPGMPSNAADALGIASLSRTKRNFVLKPSGYDLHASWSEGVVFLQQLSRDKAAKFLGKAATKKDGLIIVQEFHRGKKIPVKVLNGEETENLHVRIRLTPYADPKTGKLLIVKATGRAGTDFIHASSDSINTAVGIN